ncbi:type IX secretion system sortase PorU [Cecembia sp.]|uniref:type IX secretion system sortase PorU n=1 Tax=Cecembia sp. TaxID=1898110 RepID=UPI0025C1BCA5|nr:type IX secretion system sortase PorU [Cecembia sp.]
MKQVFKPYLTFFCSFFIFASVQFFSQAQGNGTYYKFPIVEDGIYRLGLSEAKSMGFDNLEAVGLFGFPGMLPQKLDSLDLFFKPIPRSIKGESVYFFLQGPHTVQLHEEDFDLKVHPYTDTLYYLIGPAASGHPEIIFDQSENTGSPIDEVHSVQFLKWEETNILISGRSWYSKPIFNRERQSFNFPTQNGVSGNHDLRVKIMGQSISDSRMEFFHNNGKVGEVSIGSIPNTTFGIKGREAVFRTALEPASNYNIQVNFNSADVNGSGYLAYGLLASPFAVNSAPEGLYFSKKTGLIQKRPELRTWKIRDIYNVEEVEGNKLIETGDRILFFSEANIPLIRNWQPLNIQARETGKKAQLIVIAAPSLLSQANRLAAHKNQKGIATVVFTPEQLYDAFSHGSRDITAFRNFLAYHYHKEGSLRNVLFFGKGTFDYKGKLGGRPNLVPTYSSRSSLNPLTTFSSDDYFGFLDFGQGDWEESNSGDELLKIGVGRIPATNFQEASEAVNKIIAYENGKDMEGTWKRRVSFFADDGDNNIHLNDAETHADYLSENHPEFEVLKLYLDRFEQVRNNGIQSSAAAKTALNEQIKDGLLILNYIGHGNETTLTAERVFTVSDLQDWPENPYLPLFITATCEFGRQDSPFLRSGAEELLFAEKKGAIALLTTGRPVFSSVNFALNKAFIAAVFQAEEGRLADLGTIFMQTKNNSLNGPFNRNFSLIGDPSLRLAVPELKAETDEIWDIQLELPADTLSATQEISIRGNIIDPVSGAKLSGLNGLYELSLFDRPQKVETLGDESNPTTFMEEQNTLFRGSGEVLQGEFTANLFIPKNLSPDFANGVIRVMASLQGGKEEAIGAKRIILGGKFDNPNLDDEGPIIKLFFGEELLETAPIIPSSSFPVKILLSDKSGINIAKASPNKDVTIQINEEVPRVLNQHFKALEGGFQSGEIKTELTSLREGVNTILIKAWDNLGNSSQLESTIEVRGSLQIRITQMLSYPNPAIEKSRFVIAHNRPGENLNLKLEVYSMKGDEIFSTSRRYPVAPSVLDNLEWIFFHNKTKNPAKGMYIYKLQLMSEKDGTSDIRSGKIIIQ